MSDSTLMWCLGMHNPLDRQLVIRAKSLKNRSGLRMVIALLVASHVLTRCEEVHSSIIYFID